MTQTKRLPNFQIWVMVVFPSPNTAGERLRDQRFLRAGVRLRYQRIQTLRRPCYRLLRHRSMLGSEFRRDHRPSGPSWPLMAEIGSCQVGGCVRQATAPFLLSASRVPSCVVATWMSRATTARGQLPLASSEKHHTLSVMSRSSRASAANHLSTFRPRCQGRRCASCVTTPRANRPNSATDSGYFRAQYLGHVIDIPVVTQPQVPMFPKVKSTTEIPQVPFMMVHRWLPLGTGGSISQLFRSPKDHEDPAGTAR